MTCYFPDMGSASVWMKQMALAGTIQGTSENYYLSSLSSHQEYFCLGFVFLLVSNYCVTFLEAFNCSIRKNLAKYVNILNCKSACWTKQRRQWRQLSDVSLRRILRHNQPCAHSIWYIEINTEYSSVFVHEQKSRPCICSCRGLWLMLKCRSLDDWYRLLHFTRVLSLQVLQTASKFILALEKYGLQSAQVASINAKRNLKIFITEYVGE